MLFPEGQWWYFLDKTLNVAALSKHLQAWPGVKPWSSKVPSCCSTIWSTGVTWFKYNFTKNTLLSTFLLGKTKMAGISGHKKIRHTLGLNQSHKFWCRNLTVCAIPSKCLFLYLNPTEIRMPDFCKMTNPHANFSRPITKFDASRLLLAVKWFSWQYQRYCRIWYFLRYNFFDEAELTQFL